MEGLRLRSTLIVVAVTLAIMLSPSRAAFAQASPPDAPTLLRNSLASMQASLHQVHTTGHDTIADPCCTRPAKMQVSGNCVTTFSSLAARFWIRGTRLGQGVGGTAKLERINERFTLVENYPKKRSRTWERSARTGGRWRRADSNNDALAFISLCPASPSFLLGCADQACNKLEVMIPVDLINLGPEQVRGFMTWHLRSDATRDITDPANPTAHVQTIQDFYIDQSSLFLVRLSSTTHYRTDSGYESNYVSVRNYSNFNKPVTIKPPKVGASKP